MYGESNAHADSQLRGTRLYFRYDQGSYIDSAIDSKSQQCLLLQETLTVKRADGRNAESAARRFLSVRAKTLESCPEGVCDVNRDTVTRESLRAVMLPVI